MTLVVVLRGTALTATPEQASAYNRNALKKQFVGNTKPPFAKRLELAKKELERPDLLAVLGQRASFQSFTKRVASWR